MSYENSIADTISEKYRADALRVFISGLRKPLCDILFASRPSDLPSALALAQEVDANNERYAFAKNFANRSNENSYQKRVNPAHNSPSQEQNTGHKNPHYSINEQRKAGNSRNSMGYQKPQFGNNYSDRRRVEPMEVDPSLSQIRHPTNNPTHDRNDRQHGNMQKRAANSGRYTGPKIQRVNHLNDEHDLPDIQTYDEEAEQAIDDIEGDELNFLGQGLSCLGLQGR